jgi:hypothetical protein
MESIILLLQRYWLLLATAFSLFWGIRSAYLFRTNMPSHGAKFFIASYQFLFNFIGSFAGWCCFYVLLVRINGQPLSTRDFSGGDVVLFVVSLLALTGHLPQATYGIIQAVESLAQKAIAKMTGA